MSNEHEDIYLDNDEINELKNGLRESESYFDSLFHNLFIYLINSVFVLLKKNPFRQLDEMAFY